VSFALDPGQSIVATVMETGVMPPQTVTGTASGDIASLDGAYVFAVLEDSASLFSSSWVTASADGRFSVSLTGATLSTPGHYTGTLRIHAALDPEGRQPVADGPVLVPYDVTVLDAIALSTTSITVEAPFGAPATTRTVTATVTPYATSWSTKVGSTQGCYVAGHAVTPGAGNITCEPDGTITVTFFPGAPGTYTRTLEVQAVVVHGGRTSYFRHDVVVTQVVTPDDSVDYVASPPLLQITRTQGDTAFEERWYSMTPNTGATLSWSGLEYLTHPATADGHPKVASWWYGSPYQGTATCSTSGGTTTCLPEGTYTARVHFVLTRNGVQTDVYYPLTMTIFPPGYFATQLGSYRDYQYAGSASTAMRNQVVASSSTSVSTKTVDGRTPSDSYLTDFQLAAGGWYMAASKHCALDGTGCVTTTFSPAAVALPASLAPGHTETTVSTAAGAPYGTMTRVATVNGVESVTVPAGTFSALKITTRTTAGAYPWDHVAWWVPGIGEVKISDGGSQTWVLTGYGVAPVP
jgi:hypothetical protein